jgi:dihydrofolate reductase
MTAPLGRVICNITISADGYSAGLNQTEERPFGDDGGDGWGNTLHSWMFDHAEENQADVHQGTDAGAFIMGRNMFGPVRGEWDRPWNGWWGDDPPFHAPVFVLTHHPRDPQSMDGGTTYHFGDRRDRVGAGSGPGGGGGPRCLDPGRRRHHQPVPRRRPGR